MEEEREIKRERTLIDTSRHTHTNIQRPIRQPACDRLCPAYCAHRNRLKVNPEDVSSTLLILCYSLAKYEMLLCTHVQVGSVQFDDDGGGSDDVSDGDRHRQHIDADSTQSYALAEPA